jgi:toxin ParE1/3/4
MTRVVISSVADADTAEILAYLVRHAGHATATRYRSLFEDLYDRLAVHPDSGPPRPVLGPSVRLGIVPPYLVIYEHEEAADTLTVLRIVHGRRKITGKLLSS